MDISTQSKFSSYNLELLAQLFLSSKLSILPKLSIHRVGIQSDVLFLAFFLIFIPLYSCSSTTELPKVNHLIRVRKNKLIVLLSV